MKERILKLLASGIPPAHISQIVGCTPAYVSQLLANSEFKEKLAEELISKPADAEEEQLDIKYAATEHRILHAINNSLEGAKLGELTRTLEVVAKRQTEVKKIAAIRTAPASGKTVVNLTLPAIFYKTQAPAIEMNSESEVISIGGNNLAPLQAGGVKSLFDKLKERRMELQQLATSEQDIVEGVLNVPEDF